MRRVVARSTIWKDRVRDRSCSWKYFCTNNLFAVGIPCSKKKSLKKFLNAYMHEFRICLPEDEFRSTLEMEAETGIPGIQYPRLRTSSLLSYTDLYAMMWPEFKSPLWLIMMHPSSEYLPLICEKSFIGFISWRATHLNNLCVTASADANSAAARQRRKFGRRRPTDHFPLRLCSYRHRHCSSCVRLATIFSTMSHNLSIN